MNNILIVGLYRGKGSFGGVINYLNLLLENLNKSKFKTFYFSLGKSPNWYRGEDKTSKYVYWISHVKKLVKFVIEIKRKKIQIVHLNSGLTQYSLFREGIFSIVAKILGCNTIFFIHGWKEKEFEKIINNSLKTKLTLILFKKQDAIAVLARQFKEKIVDLGVDSKNIFVSSTMVESKKYYQEDKDFEFSFKILFCAGMHRKKGPYEVLDAAPFVVEKYPDTKFIFMGEGVELENLKNFCSEMELNSNVKFIGYKEGEEKIIIFKKSHIFVYPSYTEGFPLVILEAMAAGMPLVTTPVGGLADAVENGKQGLVIESMPPKPEEIAEKIIKLIENPELMIEMSKNNLREAKEEYDVRIVCRNIEKIYEGITREE